jgi:hypothetical protein
MSDADHTKPAGDEKAQLLEHLQLVQQSLLWKVGGLSGEDLRRPMTRTGTNLIGIVKHLTGITYGYLCSAFGRERETLPWELDEELLHGLDMWATPDESTDDIIAAYRRSCEAAAETINQLDLDTTGRRHSGTPTTLREMIITVLVDTTRHAGHADVVREMIDGRIGFGPNDAMVYHDDEHLRMYRARITGEIDRQSWLAYNRSRPDYDPQAWVRHQRSLADSWPCKNQPSQKS